MASVWSGMNFEEIQTAADEMLKDKDVDTSAHLYFGDVIILIANLAARLKEQAELGKQVDLEELHTDQIEAMAIRLEKCEAKNEWLKKELEKHRWIPVSERLPEDGQYVLIVTDGGVDNVNWYATYHTTTHWKPIILPEQALKEAK